MSAGFVLTQGGVATTGASLCHVADAAPDGLALESTTRRRVLIVEDELLLAMDLEAILEDGGFAVMKPVSTVARAMDSLSNVRPDVVTST